MQLIRRYRGGRNVVTTLNDDPRNIGQSVSIRDQLTFCEPAAMKEIVILDARESQRVIRIAEVSDKALIRLQGDSGSFPSTPGHTRWPMHLGIGVEQQVVVGGNG